MNVISHEIPYCDPIIIFEKMAEKNWAIFLDSSDHLHQRDGTNRYSYICVDPFDSFVWEQTDSKNLSDLDCAMQGYTFIPDPQLPPFQGGLAGFISYDVCHAIEQIAFHRDGVVFPYMMFGLYDCIISFDHLEQRAWIVASGLSEEDKALRMSRARQRIQQMLSLLRSDEAPRVRQAYHFDGSQLRASFNKEDYIKSILKCQEYIRQGDIFEVNLSQQFSLKCAANMDYFQLYKNLRNKSPAPFSAYLNFGKTVIASGSPERFLNLKNGLLEARPIKGTIRRGLNQDEDQALADFLLNSEKDRSENIMIVDLMRNDFSKVCEPGSVIVEKLCGLESYSNVHHLVSVVKGKINNGVTASDVLKAAFPGGSITGAPKIRAMEIIAELERNERGPYCGSIGFIGFDGVMDLSITIRTFCINDHTISFQAGGAIVLSSDPEQEYQETLDKLSGLRQALFARDIYDTVS